MDQRTLQNVGPELRKRRDLIGFVKLSLGAPSPLPPAPPPARGLGHWMSTSGDFFAGAMAGGCNAGLYSLFSADVMSELRKRGRQAKYGIVLSAGR